MHWTPWTEGSLTAGNCGFRWLATDVHHPPIAGVVAGEAAADPGPAPATPGPDPGAAPTPGRGPAPVRTARAHEEGPGPGPRVRNELIGIASHVQNPKIKIERACVVLGEC